MDRRRILRWSLALGTVGVAGCVADSGGDPGDGPGSDPDDGTGGSTGSTAAGSTSTPPAVTNETRYERTTPPPDPTTPSTLSAEAAVNYAGRLELRRSYAELAVDDLDRLSLDCETYLHRETRDGYVVLSGCGGYAEGGATHADRGGVPAFYHVTRDRTVAIPDPDQSRVPEDEAYRGPAGENLNAETGFRTYNFRGRETRLEVRIDHRGSGERAYEGTHDLPGESGLVVADVVGRLGTYDVTVRAGGSGDSGVEATATWSVTGRRDAGYDPLAVTLVDGPDLGIRRSRVEEIVGLGPV